MPHKNKFIPHQLSIKNEEVEMSSGVLRLIRDDDDARVWYKNIQRFPCASVRIMLRTPMGWPTLAQKVKARLYSALVEDTLRENLWNAQIAGLTASISVGSLGLELSLWGYTEKMHVLLEEIVSMMRKLVIVPERFVILKECLTQTYRDSDYQLPLAQATDMMRCLCEEKEWMNDEYAAELEHIEAHDIMAFFPQLFKDNHIEVLALGDLTKEEASAMTNIITSSLHSRSLPVFQWGVRRAIMLPPGSNYIYERRLTDLSQVNSCIAYYLYIGDMVDDMSRANLLLLMEIFQQPALAQLCSKEKLAYAIESRAHCSATTIGYLFVIQSEHLASYLEARIDSFLDSFTKTLVDMSEEEFESQKERIVSKLEKKPGNLGDETARLWDHIKSEGFGLWNETAAGIIRDLSKQDFIDFYSEYIDPMSETRAKLSIHLNARSAGTDKMPVAKAEGTDAPHILPTGSNSTGTINKKNPIHISDVHRFKAGMPLGPGPIDRDRIDPARFSKSAGVMREGTGK
ncbi:metalloprotease, putative [Talaromyces stipitatus ATCC 10500]|uniref:Metalloprotease, putative n=1 Tax=Talaromyces stipitatus (strain ATCC 10500 / CBS 375.48 / QM 6759 / NRRL 1006) TaxID=441959 RepID=B8MUL8_TALSN|nr:metalloprotease, putative [Talaromyces stipitatus ATCC 10500]EED11686.1 metalloprotease, putative [Talaromyces stipitatus ATCC 10500]